MSVGSFPPTLQLPKPVCCEARGQNVKKQTIELYFLQANISLTMAIGKPEHEVMFTAFRVLPDSDSGRKVVQGTCVVFNGSSSEVATNLTQTQPKNDQFLAEYAPW